VTLAIEGSFPPVDHPFVKFDHDPFVARVSVRDEKFRKQVPLELHGPGYYLLIMSRAFVKETDAVETLPERPVSEHPNYVTARGLALIEDALARAEKDYAAAQAAADRDALAASGRDLHYWQQRRASAELIPPPPDTATVHFGSTVTIERDDGRRQAWQIVGEDEADPAKGTLSYVSPVAKALAGRKVGDLVTAGNSEAEIVSIE
jgi:transcription elongation GreA/GreB family factor